MYPFEAIVALCRGSVRAVMAGADLVLEVKKADELDGLFRIVETGNFDYEIRLNGKEVPEGLSKVAHGDAVSVTIHGLVKEAEVVANNISDMLNLHIGKFLGAEPGRFFLISENYASWEAGAKDVVLSYRRALRLTNELRRLADVVIEKVGTAGVAVFLPGRKLEVPIVYSARDLEIVPQEDAIDEFEAVVFDEHHSKARLEITKRVLLRFFDSTVEVDRFREMLRRVPEVTRAVLADFDIYISEFNFDKVREDFERRKLDFVVKVNDTASDAMNKIIAIPVGQGLLASQMKVGHGFGVVNVSLLLGALVFALMAVVVLIGYVSTLDQINSELATEKAMLEERAKPTFLMLSPMITELEKRITFYRLWVPLGLAVLLVLTTAMTVVAYMAIYSD